MREGFYLERNPSCASCFAIATQAAPLPFTKGDQWLLRNIPDYFEEMLKNLCRFLTQYEEKTYFFCFASCIALAIY